MQKRCYVNNWYFHYPPTHQYPFHFIKETTFTLFDITVIILAMYQIIYTIYTLHETNTVERYSSGFSTSPTLSR